MDSPGALLQLRDRPRSRFCESSVTVASAFPRCLRVSVIKDAEMVVEVASQNLVGESRKWNYLAVTEALKAFFRLSSFRDGGYRLLLQGGETVNNGEEVPEDSSAHHQGIGNPGRSGGNTGPPGYISDPYGNLPRDAFKRGSP